MTGVDIVGALLLESADVLARVPEGNIKAGLLTEDVGLDALLVREISNVERLRLKRSGLVRYTDRVSVTVRARTYDGMDSIRKIVRRVCAGFTGSMEGATNIAITSAGSGPDLIGPGNTFEKAVDFMVTYEAAG